jgi:tetratricopeptide (TPR) repeat protein
MFRRKDTHRPDEHWYRSADWDAVAQTEFEARLARARPHNRVQYRRIKALALLGSRDHRKEAAGYAMLAAIADDPDAENFEKVMALSTLGAYEQERGHLDAAERTLRRAVAAMTLNASGGDGLEQVRLAEVLLARGDAASIDEARDLLEAGSESIPPFPEGRFRFCAAAARLALAVGERDEAARWASAALHEAGAANSGLPRHPTVGLVRADRRTLNWLSDVAKRRT